MGVKRKSKRNEIKGFYGKNSNQIYSGCSTAGCCGPNFEIVLNIKQRKESQEENKVE
ncbi:MAG: hypothetical protein QXO71_05910 [Candidatus Jordarchaeaceae archaeon]